MDRPLEGVLLASDLDGTLIGSDYIIPRRNLDAVARFQRKGGRFTVATGRTMVTGRRFISLVAPNAPCILINGALLYDFEQEKNIVEYCLGEHTRPVVQAMMEQYPSMGVQAFCGKEIYLLRGTERVRHQIIKDGLTVLEAELDEIPLENCHKFLFSDDSKTITSLKTFTSIIGHDKIYFVQSSSYYLELMPAGVNKGTGLLVLAEHLGIERRHTFAIGDYYNDAEILEAAAQSACPANAPDDLKQMAGLTVGHCDDGAVADFIEYIEEIYSA